MNHLEKTTLFNTTRYFTKLKPTIINHVEDKFESKLFLDENNSRKGFGGLRYKNFFKVSIKD